jgi:hypothetical protein
VFSGASTSGHSDSLDDAGVQANNPNSNQRRHIRTSLTRATLYHLRNAAPTASPICDYWQTGPFR